MMESDTRCFYYFWQAVVKTDFSDEKRLPLNFSQLGVDWREMEDYLSSYCQHVNITWKIFSGYVHYTWWFVVQHKIS